MNKKKFASHPHSALEQLKKNSCSWIGRNVTGSMQHASGQTFECPDDGELDNIQVYSTAVPHPGKVILTLHAFDKNTKTWGPVLSTSEIEVTRGDADHWMSFPLPAIPLHKDSTYGFRLSSPDAFVGIGEAAWPSKSPFMYGEEWHGDSAHKNDQYFRYFSLAFKVELRA
jgi:hypothetical protein